MAKKINYSSLYTLRKDGRYQGSYTDKFGCRKYVYDRDPENLWNKMQKIEEEMGEDKPPTVLEVVKAWEKAHREEITTRTWLNYKPHVEEILGEHGDKDFSELSALDVANDLKRAKARGLSMTVVNTRRSIFRMVFDYAVIHGITQYNPVSSIKLPKGLHRGKRSAPTDEQIAAIIQNIDAPFGLFPFFLLCTGLRKSEALALSWDDVDMKNKVINVTKSLDYTIGAKPKLKPPKTEAGTRTIPIIDVLVPHLEKAKSISRSTLVFPGTKSTRGGPGGGYMSERAYEGAWLRFCQHAGLMDGDRPAVTAHNLRHGTATLMFENKVDEKTAQRILGHSRIEITREIYTDLRAAQNQASIELFSAGMSEMMSKSKKDDK